jgi:RNA polymerase sigma factor (sigma-70 family)
MKSLVLIVDDEAAIVEGLTAMLSFENIECAGASDRLSAQAEMQKRFYPIILADIRLRTEEEGLELLDDVRRLSPRSRVISMTGYGTPELRAEVMQRGSTLVMQKPMQSVEILSAIAHLLTEIEQLANAQATENLDELYADVRKLLYSIPQRQYRLNADEAEDIVQEAWLLFLERRGAILDNRSWLAGTVRNLSRRQIDASRRSREKFCSTDDMENLASERDTPEDRIAMQTILATLDATSRSLCNLIAVEGYSYDEVSAATGLPIGSIGPMYLRAKKKMNASACRAATPRPGARIAA